MREELGGGVKVGDVHLKVISLQVVIKAKVWLKPPTGKMKCR